jgi:D-glucosaminate-6-phosphate ammonia-lyase
MSETSSERRRNSTPDFLERFGLESIINGASWLTALGGSIMAPEVVAAMNEATRHFVDIAELNRRAGEYVASVTGAEAGLVTSGCSPALVLQAAACMTGADEIAASRLPLEPPAKREIVIQKAHRNRYDGAYLLAGAQLVEAGMPMATAPWQLEGAITERTCAVAVVYGPFMKQPLALEEIVRIAHARGVPVIVDAAAQLPPPENLTRFISMGVDMVAFSGGKGVGGPQSSGILAGRKDLIDAAVVHSLNLSSPYANIGRPLKATKESIVGLVRALELFLQHDHKAQWRTWRRWCESIAAELKDIEGLDVRAEEAGRPAPQAVVYFEEGWRGPSAEQIVERLKQGSPPIHLSCGGFRGELFVMPVNMREGEEAIVARRLREELLARRG